LNSHDRKKQILRCVESLGASAGTRLLDIPSGAGPVIDGTRALGCDVVEVDLFPRPNLRGVLADACAPFPFVDGAFDIVLSMEGIEHFEDQTGFLRECARTLKPGGSLVLTTPNILHLGARASAFVMANRVMTHGFLNEVSTLRGVEGKCIYHGHAYLIDAFRLRYILRVVGLELDEVHGTKLSATSVLLCPLVPLLWLLTTFAVWSARRRRERAGLPAPGPELEHKLKRLAFHRPLLFRSKLIYVARKPAPNT